MDNNNETKDIKPLDGGAVLDAVPNSVSILATHEWKVKDITFTADNRKKVTKQVKKLIYKGWQLYDGEVINGQIYGTENRKGVEVIQMNDQGGGRNPFEV